MSSTCNYIKVKLSTKDIESIEENLKDCYQLWIAAEWLCVSNRSDRNIILASIERTLTMFRKRVKNGIKEKAAKGTYKRTETYKK